MPLQTGFRYGNLVVLKEKEIIRRARNTYGYPINIWGVLCKCDCGNEKFVAPNNLLSGATISCGCYHKKITGLINKSHGLSRDRLYRTWCDMKKRCSNPNVWNYKNYGGRGIKVCDEWINSFECFRDWAYKNGYDEKLTIDRKDNNGNYEPGNCKWSTHKEQVANSRRVKLYTAFGETKHLAEWKRDSRTVVSSVTVQRRLKLGYSIELALTEPAKDSRFKEGEPYGNR